MKIYLEIRFNCKHHDRNRPIRDIHYLPVLLCICGTIITKVYDESIAYQNFAFPTIFNSTDPWVCLITVRAIMLRVFLAAVIVLISVPAFADWIDPGAAYYCDTKKGLFVLAAVMDTDNEGVIPIEKGFVPLSKDSSSTDILCKIPGATISANFVIIPPSERGMCSAYNHLDLRYLRANKMSLFGPELFNSSCFLSPVLYRIEITKVKDKISIRSCRGTFDWTKAYNVDGKCELKVQTLTPHSRGTR